MWKRGEPEKKDDRECRFEGLGGNRGIQAVAPPLLVVLWRPIPRSFLLHSCNELESASFLSLFLSTEYRGWTARIGNFIAFVLSRQNRFLFPRYLEQNGEEKRRKKSNNFIMRKDQKINKLDLVSYLIIFFPNL